MTTANDIRKVLGTSKDDPAPDGDLNLDQAVKLLEEYAYRLENEERRDENQKHARDQASAQMEWISNATAAMECDFDRLEELREMKKDARLVMWNMPGYLPDSEPFVVADSDDARNALADEMEERADQIEQAADLQGPDDNGRDDKPDEVRADVAEMRALREAAKALRDDDCEEYGQTIGNMHYSFTQADRPADDDDAEELADLEKAAGEYDSQDEARERIQDDALDINVRSGWVSLGDEMTPDEFTILLCTGGPAVRIRGELDDNREPHRCWLEYQDWGTPWIEYHGDNLDTDALLKYAGVFFYGE